MPVFLGPGDVTFFQNLNKEAYKLFFFKVKVFKLKKGEFNRSYGEDPNRLFEEPYEIEAYLPTLPPWKNKMTRFGLDEGRNMIIYFSLDLLKERSVPFPDIGDHIEMQGDTYKIMQTNPIDYGSNIQIPLSHICELQRVRPEKPDEGTVVYKDY